MIGLAERPATVLFVAMRAMGLLDADRTGKLALLEMAREHLIPGGDFYVGDYVGLSTQTPGVLEIVPATEKQQTGRG